MRSARALLALFVPHVRRRRAYLQLLAVALVALRRLLGAIRFRKVEVDLALGTGDPATTGLAAGAVATVSGLARSKCRAVRFRMHPVFGGKRLSVDGRVEVSLAPADLFRALFQTGYAALRKRELRRHAFGFLWRSARDLFKD